MSALAINGERLTTWAVSGDGERVRLGFADDAGQSCSMSLPVSLLNALMMTIPRILRQALETRFGDGSLRMVQPLGNCQVERATCPGRYLLSLATADGFDVTFALSATQAEDLGAVLLQVPADSPDNVRILN